jgi:hypothetical protein
MSEFRTFCHISEYGEAGYRHLHRMIASSSPLVLWAPSSTLLTASRVEPREFVRLVEEGHVRVFAREPWLLSPVFRNRHPWGEGAAWTPSVDGELRKIAETDRDLDLASRRVIVAPPERGFAWAEQYVDENAILVERVRRTVARGKPEKHIPHAVLEAIRRDDYSPRQAVTHVLRAAYNHGDALGRSGATAPFYLGHQDGQFLRWISQIDPAGKPASPRAVSHEHENYADLAAQLLDLLRVMEIVGGATDLHRFVGSEGHRELVRWYAAICRCVAVERPKSIEDKVAHELNRVLDDGRLQHTFRSWSSRRGEATVFALGLSTAVAGPFVDGPSLLSVAGVLLGAVPVGKGLLRRMGYVSAQYSGAQWPFLYSFGREASARRIRRLRRALDLAAEA